MVMFTTIHLYLFPAALLDVLLSTDTCISTLQVSVFRKSDFDYTLILR